MDEPLTVRYLLFHYFSGPMERVGFPFVLLASRRSDNAVDVHEASEWRSKVNEQDSDYMEALLRSFQVEQHAADTLFAELDSMSAGCIRVVGQGRTVPEDIPGINTELPSFPRLRAWRDVPRVDKTSRTREASRLHLFGLHVFHVNPAGIRNSKKAEVKEEKATRFESPFLLKETR